MKPNEMSRMEFLFVLSGCLLATGCTTMDLATQKQHADGTHDTRMLFAILAMPSWTLEI